MKRSRVTILTLMIVVAWLSLAFAALKVASPAWKAGVERMTFLALAGSVVLARYRPGHSGAFWFGFAAFGWAYMLCTFAMSNDFKNLDESIGWITWFLVGRGPGIPQPRTTEDVDIILAWNLRAPGVWAICKFLMVWVVATLGGCFAIFVRSRNPVLQSVEIPR